MKFRDLEKVRCIIKEATGLDLTFAYDDLVFPEHMAFMIQFNDADSNSLFCHFHNDCNPDDKERIFEELSQVATKEKIALENKGRFELKQKDEEVEIDFFPL